MFRSGFVGIVGMPNVGKSTLLNSILGKKVAITSDKVQTTRNTITGVYTDSDKQIIFLDTPGIHRPQNELGARLNEKAYDAINKVDLILFVVSFDKPLGAGVKRLVDRLKKVKKPIILVLNKRDLARNIKLYYEFISEHLSMHEFQGTIPMSANEPEDIKKLLDEIASFLPEGPMYYPGDMISDRPENFIICELIREKVLYFTFEEVPHSIAVMIENINHDEQAIQAVIIVERDSQKKIIIGDGGAMIKKVRLLARKEINRLLGVKYDLELWVKVKKDWRNNPAMLKQIDKF